MLVDESLCLLQGAFQSIRWVVLVSLLGPQCCQFSLPVVNVSQNYVRIHSSVWGLSAAILRSHLVVDFPNGLQFLLLDLLVSQNPELLALLQHVYHVREVAQVLFGSHNVPVVLWKRVLRTVCVGLLLYAQLMGPCILEQAVLPLLERVYLVLGCSEMVHCLP